MSHSITTCASKCPFSLKNDLKRTTNDLDTPQTWSFIFSSCSGIQNTCLCEVSSQMLYNCSRNYIFSTILRFLTFEIFPILTRSAWTLKITMLNKSGYFRTLASMIESTALDFWRKSKKPEIESYIIDHDFRKIQVKNTGSYWILPYIYILKSDQVQYNEKIEQELKMSEHSVEKFSKHPCLGCATNSFK